MELDWCNSVKDNDIPIKYTERIINLQVQINKTRGDNDVDSMVPPCVYGVNQGDVYPPILILLCTFHGGPSLMYLYKLPSVVNVVIGCVSLAYADVLNNTNAIVRVKVYCPLVD